MRAAQAVSATSMILILMSAWSANAAPQNPLYVAARDGDEAAVSRLLSAGADPNRGEGWQTPLLVAANQGHLGIVERLLAAGASPRAAHADIDPLVAAGRGGHIAVVRRLLVVSPAPAETLAKALHAAAREGHPLTVGALVSSGANLTDADEEGLTALHLAAKWGRAETARALLDLGAPVDATDARGRSALLWASWRAHPDVARLLVRRGADPDRRDASGNSALLGEPSLGAAFARMLEARRRAVGTAAACSVVIVPGTARARREDAITAWGLQWPPPVGEEGWAIPMTGGSPVRLWVSHVPRDECSGDSYEPQLGPVSRDLPSGREYLIVLPAAASPPVPLKPIQTALPWGVFLETVRAMADSNGDGRADLLLRSFCCGDDSRPWSADCEYSCWDGWSLQPEGWRRCSAGGPC